MEVTKEKSPSGAARRGHAQPDGRAHVLPPVVDMRAAGVEIGSSIAYAADVTYELVKASALNSTTFTAGQSYKVVNDAGKELARFTTVEVYGRANGKYSENPIETELTYDPSAGKITLTKGAVENLTISANTEVMYDKSSGGFTADDKEHGYINAKSVIGNVTLEGGGATYSTNIGSSGYHIVAATAEGSTGTLTYQKDGSQVAVYKCTGGTKISAIDSTNASSFQHISGTSDGGVIDISGIAGDGNTYKLTIQGGTTVDTGQAKITTPAYGRCDLSLQKDTTIMGDGAYDDIKKSEVGTGTLKFKDQVSITVNNLAADTLNVFEIKANNLTVGTLITGSEHGATVEDTLTVEHAVDQLGDLIAGTIIGGGDIKTTGGISM